MLEKKLYFKLDYSTENDCVCISKVISITEDDTEIARNVLSQSFTPLQLAEVTTYFDGECATGLAALENAWTADVIARRVDFEASQN